MAPHSLVSKGLITGVDQTGNILSIFLKRQR